MSKHKPAKTDSRRAQMRAAQIAQAKKQKNQRIAIIAVAAVVTIALVVGVFLLVNRFNDSQAASAPPSANANQSGMKVWSGNAKPNAPVVALFLDYQCPACANFERNFGSSLEGLAKSGDIQLEYRTMTFLDTNLRNDSSTRAANAAVCADVAGHYAEYHNAVFAHQPSQEGNGYTNDNLTKDFTAQAGITGEALDQFNSCYANKRFSSFVNKVDDEAGRSGVTGTPSIQVNGKTLDMNKLTTPDSLRTEIMALA